MNTSSLTPTGTLNIPASQEFTTFEYFYLTEVLAMTLGMYIWTFSNDIFLDVLVQSTHFVLSKVLFGIPISVVNTLALQMDAIVWWYLGICGFLD
jgi:hypothetical protein